ncbi:molybdopterin-binding domain-containing protein, partial [Acetobacter nitrogenifigens]
KAWFGSGTGYADAVKQVSAMLAAIGAVGSDTYTASLAKQLAQQGVDATLAVKQSVDNLNSNVAQLRRLITVGGVKAA